MVSPDRWKVAQQYERGYWARRAREIAEGATSQLEWYRWRSDQLQEKLRGAGFSALLEGDSTVVEVGSGPVGVAGFFSAERQILVDPLSDYYAEIPALVALRNPEAQYLRSGGESLPLPDGCADLVICENCIDHVSDFRAVMNEICRILRPDGVFYITVNCRSRPGFLAHRVLSSCRLDPGHPHTFTPRRLRRLLAEYHLTPAVWEVESFTESWVADWKGPGVRPRMKAFLGVSEYLALAIASRAQIAALR